MSYILDALRRADAERDRGGVPGLHTQPAPLPSADDLPPRRNRAWPWPLVGAALALIAALAWWGLGRDTPPPDLVASSPATAPAPAPAPAPAAIPAPIVPTPPVPAALPAPPPLPSAAAAVAADAVKRPQAVAPAAPAAPARKAVPQVVVPPVAAKPPASAPLDARIYKLSELPDEVRTSLPALAVGGAMYSQTPANRMLIVNGQLFHEGDTLAPGLTLEQIRLKSAVLKLKGYRVGIDY